jgi:hypothetical protein
MGKKPEDNILTALKSVLDQMPKEKIGDATVEDVLEAVDLSISFTPVLPDRVDEKRLPFEMPTPADAQLRQDRRYQVIRRDRRDFEIVSAEELKVMRARYLLVRDYYSDRLQHNNLHPPLTSRAVSQYFDGVFVKLPKKLAP